jgi:hypothetical protein
MTGWAGANPNNPYCEHDPACWIPIDDATFGAECCRPVSEEDCKYADHPSDLPEPSYTILREIELEAVAPEYDYRYGCIVEFLGGTITYEKTVTYMAKNKATESGACGAPFYDEDTFDPFEIDLSVGGGLGIDDKYINAGVSLGYTYKIKLGGIHCSKRVSAKRCRKPCSTRWDVYKRVALAAVPNLTIVLLSADEMELPYGNTQIDSKEKPHRITWEVSHATCFE